MITGASRSFLILLAGRRTGSQLVAPTPGQKTYGLRGASNLTGGRTERTTPDVSAVYCTSWSAAHGKMRPKTRKTRLKSGYISRCLTRRGVVVAESHSWSWHTPSADLDEGTVTSVFLDLWGLKTGLVAILRDASGGPELNAAQL